MFDKEELEILEALENNKLLKSIDADEEIMLAQNAAKVYLSKSKNVTLRISMMDLIGIKEKSKDIGIPYQTIINSLVHNYVTGKVKLF
jgi:predicted DNA binding CopG/RHH family protein